MAAGRRVRRSRRLLYSAGAMLLVAAATSVYVSRASPRMPDFEVYRTSGIRAARAEPLYRSADADYQFLYLPAFAVLAIPLGALPASTARALWYAGSVAALVALLALAVASIPERRRRTWLLVAVAVVALGKYYAENLVLGQVNLLLALIATSAVVAFNARREVTAGLLVTLAVAVKPYAIILVPWVAARRRVRSIAAIAAGSAAVVLLPAAIYGLEATMGLHLDWWRTVNDTSARLLLHSDNISLMSMYAKWLGPGTASLAAAAMTSVGLLAAAVVVFARRTGVPHPDALEAALLMTLTPLLSPQGWDFILVVATPAVVYLANYYDLLPRALRPVTAAALAIIGLTLFDLLGRRLHYALMDIAVISVAVLVLVASLCALRLRRTA